MHENVIEMQANQAIVRFRQLWGRPSYGPNEMACSEKPENTGWKSWEYSLLQRGSEYIYDAERR